VAGLDSACGMVTFLTLFYILAGLIVGIAHDTLWRLVFRVPRAGDAQ
jgi:hypothetical protein